MNIGEVAKKYNLSVPTLRYYDELGLLPNLKKDSRGNRIFDEINLSALNTIECLKDSGMKLSEIKEFMDLCLKGDSTLQERYNMFESLEIKVLEDIKKLNKTLDMIKFKKAYYNKAISDGTEKIIQTTKPENLPKNIKTLYDKTH